MNVIFLTMSMVMVVVAVQGAHLWLFLATDSLTALVWTLLTAHNLPLHPHLQLLCCFTATVLVAGACTCQECSARLSGDDVAVKSLPQQFLTVFTARAVFDSCKGAQRLSSPSLHQSSQHYLSQVGTENG